MAEKIVGRPAHRDIPNRLRANAKVQRRRITDAERKFWYAVRAHRFYGLSFRRQTPVAGYIVDFVCHEHRLIVEIDGGGHGYESTRRHDEARTARLREEGYRVLRFWNSDVLKNIRGVLTALEAELGLLAPVGASTVASREDQER